MSVSRLVEMSSRTAAWGQPPVSTATMRSLNCVSRWSRIGKAGKSRRKTVATYAGRALFLVRNSQSSRVKMSFVTAAIEKRVRKALQRASMRAVLPEPTGLKSVNQSVIKSSFPQI